MLDLGDVRAFLQSAVNPPDEIAIQNSIDVLRSLQVGRQRLYIPSPRTPRCLSSAVVSPWYMC